MERTPSLCVPSPLAGYMFPAYNRLVEGMERYTDAELSAMLRDPESDRVERKENFSGDTPRRAREAICAFANDLPNHNKAGVLFIGATDDGRPSGLKITDRLLLTLSDIKSDGNILPFPVITVEKRTLDGAEMAVVTVLPSDSTPVKYDGRIWIRTGPRRALANEQEERILSEKRQGRNVPSDLKPVYGATIGDLSRGFFEDEYLPMAIAKEIPEANHRTYEERLAVCKMIVSVDDTTPTFLGLMAIGKKPRFHIGGAYIQFLRIDGLDQMAPIIDELEIDGRVFEMYRIADAKFKAYNKRALDVFSGPTHVITHDYPETAFRQVLCNAILHRRYGENNAPIHFYWYNDRIEINSPGGPFGEVTVDNFGSPGLVSYRNRNLAEVMKNLDLGQRFGFGIKWARETMRENGNPALEFKVSSSNVCCVLRKRTPG
ncbi:MAG: putative DNA binding domain-containing protein [Treponema sp.]|nr:putative DNA binding domain-containing protein [Treponema sp.]